MATHPGNKYPYKLAKALGNPHRDTINFLSFSPCGRFLASGGDDDYMCIYDCSDPRHCEVSLRIKANSPPSAICWNPTTPISVFVGYGNGGVVQHCIDKEEGGWLPGVLLQNGPDRIVSLASDQILVVATQSTVYFVDQDNRDIANWVIIPKPAHNAAIAERKPEPRSVAFASDGSILIAYLKHGISCWARDGKTQKWDFHPRAFRIGRFSYDSRKNMFIVHNLFDGFDAYKIKGSTVEHFRSYHLAAPKERNVPLSCIFIEGGKYVALGTTMGRAMILDAEKVSTKQVLHHCAEDGLVQEIAYGNPNPRGYTLIATTASECGADTVIKLWVGPAATGSDERDYAGEMVEWFTTTLNRLLDRYYSTRRRTVEIPFIWLVTGALLVILIVLSAPAEWDYSGVLGLLSRPSGISLSSVQRVISSFLRALLRSLFAALSATSVWVQQFVDEDSAVPTSQDVVQGITLVGSATAIAAAVANQHPALSIPTPGIESPNQPKPTIPIPDDAHNVVHTEAQPVIDYGTTDAPRPHGAQQLDHPVS